MRVDKISLSGDDIIKKYKTTATQQEKVISYFDEYAEWIKSCGFVVPRTKLDQRQEELELRQQYILGHIPSSKDWLHLTRILMNLPENMKNGLDANPANFIFSGSDIYFVDFYPLLVRDKTDFLRSQFSYGEDTVMQRYFNKWAVIVCFLNRLRVVDPFSFNNCLHVVAVNLLPNISHIPGRDARRLLSAGRLNTERYKEYYKQSKTVEGRLRKSDMDNLIMHLEYMASDNDSR